MPVKPEDFVAVAEHLTRIREEAFQRTEAGRLYYALFNALVWPLKEAGLEISQSGRAHRELIEYLKRSAREDLKQIGDTLDALRGLRNAADYDVRAEFAGPTEGRTPPRLFEGYASLFIPLQAIIK